MAEKLFSITEPVPYAGKGGGEELAFRHYDPEEVVDGKTMAEHLRFAVCYWHSLCWPGTDPFGGPTFDRPWFKDDSMASAKAKADAAFELFSLLRAPFFCFHDADVRPDGGGFAQSRANLEEMTDHLGALMETSGVKLLWGTANLFTHRRYQAGAATNPDPEVFAYAAATVKDCLDATMRLGGENYVLWGGREGYETLLNTDLAAEEKQLARFLHLVAEHRHKIGFKGQLLIEPKPQEPTKHQHDFDVATVSGFLHRHGLDKEYKLNIEAGHAFLAGHGFEHEIALAQSLGLFGSIDMNRNDLLSGWDTDQFPNSVAACALAYYEILRGGGFGAGGTNFDAKLRRQSIAPDDLLHAHIGGMDTCARGFKLARRMLADGRLEQLRRERYAGWSGELGADLLAGRLDLDAIAKLVAERGLDPQPKSGRQELLENIFGNISVE
ncbi:MAG: xylose isomerase [Betaproteobacteria bacterium AqS2]|uniref:Xylose isomerase n=1 Tax=Candidatus Amphirhobacter heronislandensis TaxID=1732024 RepID=A0A930UBN2_9GAMM|nr:xylose isomerase [Betaproteobacteria bacterium AqS2]